MLQQCFFCLEQIVCTLPSLQAELVLQQRRNVGQLCVHDLPASHWAHYVWPFLHTWHTLAQKQLVSALICARMFAHPPAARSFSFRAQTLRLQPPLLLPQPLADCSATNTIPAETCWYTAGAGVRIYSPFYERYRELSRSFIKSAVSACGEWKSNCVLFLCLYCFFLMLNRVKANYVYEGEAWRMGEGLVSIKATCCRFRAVRHEGRRGSREKCRRGSYKKWWRWVKSRREMRGKEMRRGGKRRRGRALSVFPQVSA